LILKISLSTFRAAVLLKNVRQKRQSRVYKNKVENASGSKTAKAEFSKRKSRLNGSQAENSAENAIKEKCATQIWHVRLVGSGILALDFGLLKSTICVLEKRKKIQNRW